MLLTFLAALVINPPVSADKGVVVGYYPSWVGDEYPPAAIDFTPFTHIGHAFLTAKPDGSVITDGTVPSQELTGLAHEAGVKVMLTVGGADSGGEFFNALGRSARARGKFIDGTLRIVEENGYDGVDLDWEFPENSRDRANLSKLAQEFRIRLDELGGRIGRRFSLNSSLPAGDYYGRWYDAAVLAKECDFLGVMTYDFTGSWRDVAAHNAALRPSPRDPQSASVIGSMEYWTKKRGIPIDKLVVGLPCYGRGFDVPEPYAAIPKGAPQSRVAEVDYRDITPLLTAGWIRRWDADSGIPWLISPDGKSILGYDDPESAAAKGRWAREAGFGGILFWEMNADRMPDGSHPVISAAVRAWRDPSPTKR